MMDALGAGPELILAILASSLVPGLLIFGMSEERSGLRTTLNLFAASIKVALVGLAIASAQQGRMIGWRYEIAPNLELLLVADELALLFLGLSAGLWLLTTVYAIGYLEGSPDRSRFFAFFSLCVTATSGIALAGNLFSFVLFYEILTWTTYPLVAHRGTQEAVRGGRIYLYYTVPGGAALLLGAIWLHAVAGPLEFVPGGALFGTPTAEHAVLAPVFMLLVAGLGVKAALIPLHGWLPVAMVAPAPVSALLHAVAVVKAGAFGIMRVVYSLFGIELVRDMGVGLPLAALASLTIVHGSIRALSQMDLKRRLAFSTVSQVSYVTLGVALYGPAATLGGLVHLVHQGIMKITLFFCAGTLSETLGIHRIDELDGVGRRMPWTMTAFTVAALGMIGVPPMAGFISKLQLGLGGIEAGEPWVIGVLALSSVLNAAYFLPLIHRAWFRPRRPEADWPAAGRWEASPWLLLPLLATGLLSIGAGLLAGFALSPYGWTERIVATEYGP
ncbi:MAG: complex I subunit 5 family protein [bacterium]